MAKPELGTKRVCLECSTRYFDLNRQPIACPKCSVVFEIATRNKTRSAYAKPKKKVAEDASPKASAVAEKTADNDTIVAAAADSEAETISLDEAEDASGDDDDDDVSNIVVGGEDEDDT